MTKLRISEFCALARNQKWQEWLKSTDKQSYNDLLAVLQNPQGGCKKNTAKMIQIRDTLHKQGKDDALFEFLNNEFPTVLEQEKLVLRKAKGQSGPATISTSKSANKHGIFKLYNPTVLTFPQKLIIIDKDHASLEKKVKHFLSNKVKSDYLIIEDRAYIEYFKSEYRREAEKFPKEKRELNIWRRNNK